MHAFGMHLHVRCSKEGLVTRDSCVVAAFRKQLQWEIRNGRPIERTTEHVGYIREILELDYQNHCTTVLRCEWVKATRDARFPSIERDRYGFSVANFEHMDSRVHPDSFAFPLYCQQVFFSDDPMRQGWKIVCRTDIRGRCRAVQRAQLGPSMVAVGNDDDFVGLQLQMLETEAMREPALVGGSYVTAPTNTKASQIEEEE